MPKYVALLGNTPSLSYSELEAVAGNEDLERSSDHSAVLTLSSDLHAQQLQSILGGTFKILKLELELKQKYEEALEKIADYLASFEDKITFGLGSLDQDQLSVSPAKVKSILSSKNLNSRYLEGDAWGLSAAILTHKPEIIDLLVFKHQDKYFLLRTISVQDVDSWTKRDRGKPYVEARKGMLPPKVARIMVNLALGHLDDSLWEESPVLYDPFCGTGTVLMEAILRGCKIIGSDLDEGAVKGSQHNLDWLAKSRDETFNYHLFKSDVAHVNEFQWPDKVDLIVTEPFLGKPNPKTAELENVFTGLESLYLGAFKTWLDILHKGSIVCMIFPQAEVTVQNQKKHYHLMKLIDKLERFGYTLLVEPIDYSREKAVIKRQILVFRLH